MRKDDITGLKLLSSGSHPAPLAPSASILEAFPNRYPDRMYIVSITFPEFTSLCPVTGQPDFGVIRVEYIPDKLCVESKSFKLYMFAFRNHQSFMETTTNAVLDDLVALLNPYWCQVKGLFAPRGGTAIHVFAEHYKTSSSDELERIQKSVRDWRMMGESSYGCRSSDLRNQIS